MRPTKKQKPSLTTVKHVFKTIILPRKSILFKGFVLIIISRLSSFVLPYSTRTLLDDIIPSKDMVGLKWLIAAVFGALVIQAITSFVLVRLLSVEAHQLIATLRSKVQKHVIHLPLKYFDDNKSGGIVSRIMTDVEGVRNLVGTGFVQLFGGVLASGVTLFFLIQINVMMTIYAIIPMIIFALVSLKAFSYIRPVFKQRRVINAEVTGRLTESIGGIKVVKGFNAEKREEDVFEKDAQRIFENVKTTLTTQSFITSVATLLIGGASTVILGVGGANIIGDTLTVGELFMFTTLLVFLVAPVVQMSNIGTQITEAFAGLDRMEEILNMEREEDDKNRTIELEDIKGDFVFSDISFEYQKGTEVVRNINFEAPSGSVTAFVGSSGSGKTTLAGIAGSFLHPKTGSITIDGIDMSKVTFNSFRSRLGVVLQDDFLFEGTIRENILFSKPEATNDEMTEAVKSAFVNEFSDRFDDGLETIIGERGVKLSGGQRQRVAIARALLANPKILILDEATSNLDTESEAFIQESLSKLMEGRTTFVIAHRLSTIRRADQILVVEKGEIVERGTHDDLIKKEGRYFDLYTYQARI